ncbi:MAG: formyltransferase family protein [Candidatus Methanomethylophilaceae archaeon]|nr:formyltransferase family protein [Candidatus Methanomethylophilaceae archaeon]
MMRLGWFSTGRGAGSRNLLRTVMDHKSKGKLDVELAFVFCNWDNQEEDNPRREQREEFFQMVRSYGIPLVTLSWKKFRAELLDSDPESWRNEYGKEMRRLLEPYDFDLGILAGYMLWVDDETCQTYDLMNLHPALPDGPKGTWQEVIWELIESGAEEQGTMMHLCTPEWDRGAALTYCRFPLRGSGFDRLWENMDQKLQNETLQSIKENEGTEEPLFKRIRTEGFRRELPLVVYSIKLFAEGVVRIEDQSLYAGDRKLDGPYDLSRQIDRSLEEGEF